MATGLGGRDEACAAGSDMGTGDDGRVTSGLRVEKRVRELDAETGDGCGSVGCVLLNGFKSQFGANFDVNDVREEVGSREGGIEVIGDLERTESIDIWEGEVLSA
jgi:hypothetical protein